MHYCSQKKEKSALLFLEGGNWYFTVFRRETGILLFLGEGNWYSTVFRRRKLVLYCFY